MDTAERALFEVFCLGIVAVNPYVPPYKMKMLWEDVRIESASREFDSITELMKVVRL